jgi:transposase-like protein
MEKCKYCRCEKLRKDGIRNGVRKWKCIGCNRSQGGTDNRIKYSEKERKVAVVLYLEGCGFRRTARILEDIFEKVFRWQTVAKWIKQGTKKLLQREPPVVSIKGKVPILEMDELDTYVKKKTIGAGYGLLLTGTDSYLIHLR